MNDLKKYQYSLLAAAVLVVAMFICSGFTSPLYPHYSGLDSSMFLITAKGLLQGKIAYIDLFDHKGPILFWIETVGYAMGGRTGVWVLQCMFAVADLFLISKICSLFQSNSFVAAITFFCGFFALFCHGNLTEEFCMPLILLGLYYEVRFLTSDQPVHPPLWAFLYGILFGIMAFIRVNNAVILCSLILCIAVILVLNGEWVNLILNMAAGILGIASVAVPVCLYYAHYDALDLMLYATFLHNFLYAKTSTHAPIFSDRLLHFAVMYLPGICSLFVFGCRWHESKSRTYLSLFVATAITYLMLVYSNVNDHYFMLGLPMFMIAAAVLLQGSGKYTLYSISDFLKEKIRLKGGALKYACISLVAITAVYAVLSCYSACAPFYKTFLSDIAYDQFYQIHQSTEKIPGAERDSVIGFGVMADFYVHADIVPCYRYYTLQRWMSTDENNIYGQFMDFVRCEQPLWLITKPDEEDSVIRSILEKSYTLITTDDYAYYYRLNQ